MSLTVAARAALQRVNDAQGLLFLVTITGGGIAQPVRLVNDTRECVSNGETFLALPFEIVLPKQAAKEVPSTQLRMDNVGRELVAELEQLEPGAELMALLQVIYRADPDTPVYESTAPLSGIRVDALTVSAVMGPSQLMRRPAVNVRFDPTTAPGLFPN